MSFCWIPRRQDVLFVETNPRGPHGSAASMTYGVGAAAKVDLSEQRKSKNSQRVGNFQGNVNHHVGCKYVLFVNITMVVNIRESIA